MTNKTFTRTTYRDGKGRVYEAVHMPWNSVRAVLGRDHDGSPEDDATLKASIGMFVPAWVADAEGWSDETGWGLIGPVTEDRT